MTKVVKRTRSDNKKKTTGEFKIESIIKNGNKYDYSNVVYINAKTNVELICNDCGATVSTTPNKHLRLKGGGCAACANSAPRWWMQGNTFGGGDGGYNETLFTRHPERKVRPAVLYTFHIYNEEESFYKVGITCQTVKRRAHHIKRESKYRYNVDVISEEHMELYEAFQREQTVLPTVTKYKPLIHFGGHTECYIREGDSKPTAFDGSQV